MRKWIQQRRKLAASLIVFGGLSFLFNNCSVKSDLSAVESSQSANPLLPTTPSGLNPSTVIKGAPLLLYTDLVAGPRSGGEQNLGAYLSLFGKNFGSDLSALHVFINEVEVAQKLLLSTSKGRSDIQQVSVRVGNLGNSPVGQKLPIRVIVNGVSSNSNLTFTINDGRILYVDPIKGRDSTAQIGDPNKPFQTVQSPDLSGGAWGQVRPGDTIVLRQGTYVGVGKEQYFARFMLSDQTSGTQPTGSAGSGYLSLIGYPGEDAFLNCTSQKNPSGCLSGLNGQTFPQAGKYIVIAGLRIEGGGYDGPISQEIYGDNWRIVNNEITAFTGVTTGASPSRMAGITGNGQNSFWLGNHIHDIQGSLNEAHGIYIDGDGSYEIAYNHIHDIKSGKGVQIYVNGGNGSDYCNNVSIHHNSIHNVLQFGVNIADGSSKGFLITNNLIYNASASGLRFNTTDLIGAKVYHNTFFNNNTRKLSSEAAISSDWNLPSGALEIKNNIFVAPSGTAFSGGSVGFTANQLTLSNNLWFGGNDDIKSLEPLALVADPQFISTVSQQENFHLKAQSPAIDRGATNLGVTNDYDLINLRPSGSGPDIGAFEAN